MFARASAIPMLVLCSPAWATVPANAFLIELAAHEAVALESEACLTPFGANLEKAKVTSHWGPWEPERQANGRVADVTCAPVSTRDDAMFRRKAWCTWQSGQWSCEWKYTFVELTVEGRQLRVEFTSKSFPTQADVARILKDIGVAIRDWPSAPRGTIFAAKSYVPDDDKPAPLEGSCRITGESTASWPEVDVEVWCDDLRSFRLTKQCRPDCVVWFSSHTPAALPE